MESQRQSGSKSLPQHCTVWPPLDQGGAVVEFTLPASYEYSQLLPLSSHNNLSGSVVHAYGNPVASFSNGFCPAAGQKSLSFDTIATDTAVQSQQLPFYDLTNGTGVKSMVSRPNPRKRKAPTSGDDDWEPVRGRIQELYIDQRQPLRQVMEVLAHEYNFQKTTRQFKTRLEKWGLLKNVKQKEMKAIVRKRQRRKLDEPEKGDLAFTLRGQPVNEKVERWMGRNEIPDDMDYIPISAPATPTALSARTVSECASSAPCPADQDMTLYTTGASENASTILPYWATAAYFKFLDFPWFQFHSLLFGFESSAYANNPTRHASEYQIPDPFIREDSGSNLQNRPESMDITATLRKQRGSTFNLEEVMPECFQTQVSVGSHTQRTLSTLSSPFQILEIGLFLAANNLLDGGRLVKSIAKSLQANGDPFFEQLFKIKSSTVQSFTCRLLESLPSPEYHGNTAVLLHHLMRCGLDLSILAGPTGGRCLQLAIWHKETSLALILIKNGAQKSPKLGSFEPFNRTPLQLARLQGEHRIVNTLLGQPNKLFRPVTRSQILERTEGEVALQNAILAQDTEQIHSLLIGGLNVDSARTSSNN